MLYAAIDIHKHAFQAAVSIRRTQTWSRSASRPIARALPWLARLLDAMEFLR